MEVSKRRPARPYLLPVRPGGPLYARVDSLDNRSDTLIRGDLGLRVHVSGLSEASDPVALLVIPYDVRSVGDLDQGPVRVYRYDAGNDRLTPVWDSGVNPVYRCVWARINRSGTYIAAGFDVTKPRLQTTSLYAQAT